MSLVNQIISAVEAGGKVAWRVFLSCAVALAFEHFLPELFVGLPEWAFPTIRIAAIFSLVLSIAAIFPTIINKAIALWQKTYAPIKRRSTRRKLLDLNGYEVLVLCSAIARQNREILLNGDMAPAISLQDKGLIRRLGGRSVCRDGKSCFEVSLEVWRVLLLMEEFKIVSHKEFLDALDKLGSGDTEPILACLPQAHPAVRAQTEKHAA